VGEALGKFTKANSAVSKATAEAAREAYGRLTGRELVEEEHGAAGASNGSGGRTRSKVTAGG
jgi:hypothetical protein